jgi:hypothetical protein
LRLKIGDIRADLWAAGLEQARIHDRRGASDDSLHSRISLPEGKNGEFRLSLSLYFLRIAEVQRFTYQNRDTDGFGLIF